VGAAARRPQDRWFRNGLLVITDAASYVASPGYEGHLRNRFWVGTRLCKHVADLSELSFRLLRRGVLFLAKFLASRVLKVSGIRAKELLSIRVGERIDLTVADIEAKWIQVVVQESTFSV
jgi:hypothetical protein